MELCLYSYIALYERKTEFGISEPSTLECEQDILKLRQWECWLLGRQHSMGMSAFKMTSLSVTHIEMAALSNSYKDNSMCRSVSRMASSVI